jgi:hypothetical protein
MFVCLVKYSSVINLIYLKQLVPLCYCICAFHCNAECRYAECLYAECNGTIKVTNSGACITKLTMVVINTVVSYILKAREFCSVRHYHYSWVGVTAGKNRLA